MHIEKISPDRYSQSSPSRIHSFDKIFNIILIGRMLSGSSTTLQHPFHELIKRHETGLVLIPGAQRRM